MPGARRRSGSSTPCSTLSMGALCAAIVMLLSSCSTGTVVQGEARGTEDTVLAAPYTVLFVIHGDGDYAYHDAGGIEHRADEEALAGAIQVAEANPRAEVFVYHQKPARHLFFVVPLHDGDFYYYRNGRLVVHEPYRRAAGAARLDVEVELYRRFRAVEAAPLASVFVYFGHAIPETGGLDYDASRPERPFTVRGLAGELRGFTGPSARFDLLVLSTCFGGTPHTVGELSSVARHVIASPENLHLSYFDLRSLERLDLTLQDGTIPALARGFARRAFDRLAREVQTGVSVAVYDVDRARAFTQAAQGVYDRELARLNGDPASFMTAMERCDCADLPSYSLPGMNEGVEVLYRPARFGRSKGRQSHSGWECWRERGPRPPASPVPGPGAE